MGSAGCIVTWWSMVKCEVSAEAQYLAKSCFSKGKELSVETRVMVDLVKTSKQYSHLPLTLQAPLDLLDHMVRVAEQPVQKPGSVEDCSHVWAILKTRSFSSQSVSELE